MRHPTPQLARHNRLHALAWAAAALVAMPSHAADFFWTTGDFVTGVTAPEPLLSGDTLFIGAGGAKRFVGGTFTNQGLVRWQADPLQGGNSASVFNSGTWQSESDANSLTHNFGGQPTFFNTGTFRKSAGVTTNVGSWRFQNDGGLIDAQVGNIVFNGGTNVFNAGSRFTGAGQVQMTAGASFAGNFQADNLVLANGSFNGSGANLTGGAGMSAGLVGWSGGDLAGDWTFAAGTTVTATGGTAKRQVGSNVLNNGTFRWSTTTTLQGGNSSVFTNNGLLEVTESALFQHNFGGQPAYINSSTGTVRATNNATLTLGGVGMTSDGGTFEAHAGSAIVYAGATSRFNGGTRFIGDNAVTGSARFVDVIQSDNLRFVSGGQTGGDGSPGSRARLAGQVGFEGGDLNGAWEIQSGATMTATGATNKRQVGSDIVNNGSFRWDTTATLQGGNSSSFVNNGLVEVKQSALFQHNFGGQPSFQNGVNGTFRATNNATLTLGNVILTSEGGRFEADAGSAIVYTGGSNRFNGGTRFIGDNAVTGSARFVDVIQSDNLRFVSGGQTGGDGSPGSRARLAGQVGFEGGDLNGAWEIQSGATMTATGATNKRQVGSDIVNNGTFRWSTTATLQGGNSSVFTNNGLLEVTESALFQHNFGGQPAYINSGTGTVRATNNATLTLGNVILTSDGGRFEADAGSAIVYIGGSNRFNGGTRFIGDNAVTGNARFVDVIQADNLRFVSGSQAGGDGSLGSRGRLAGQVGFEGGDLAGDWEIQAGSTMTATGATAKRQLGSDILNNGSFLWSTSSTLQGGNSSLFTNQGRMEFTDDGSMTHNFGGIPRLDNNGLLTKTGGAGVTSLSTIALTNAGTMDVRSGAIALPTSFTNAGTLMGTGAFNVAGTLTNNGHIAPGGSTGTLTLNTNLVQSALGTLDTELTSLIDSDLLLVNGNVSLNGTLALSCLGNCLMSVGDELVILDASGQLSGSFAGVTMAGFGSGAFDVVYDFALDRVLLRVTENVTPVPVPEPGTYALMAAGLAAVGFMVKRRRRAA